MSKTDSNSARLRRRLLKKQKDEAKKAAQRLLAQSGSNPEIEAKRLDAYNAILGKLDTGPSFDKWIAVAVALICIAIVGVLYSLPRGETKVLLEVEAETVSVRLADPLVWPKSMPITAPLQVKGLNRLDSLLDSQPLQSEHGRVWLDIPLGKTSLSEMTLDQGGEVEIETKNGQRIFFLKGSLSGSVQVSGNVHLQAGSQPGVAVIKIKKRLIGPESLDFKAADQGAVPTTFAMGADQTLVFHRILVNGLSFFRKVGSTMTSSHFVSTIVSGTITLPEVKEEIDLRPGEWLKFKALSGRLTQLNIGEKIKIRFEGNAKGIQIGPQGFERSLEPNWLAYLYNQEKLVFIWSAFLFVWGILWSIRKTIFA